MKVLSIVLMLAIPSAGCSRTSQSEEQDRSPINIGFFGDLSGPTFNFGPSSRNGVLMAPDQINKGGRINGRRIDVDFEDDHSSTERAAEFTEDNKN